MNDYKFKTPPIVILGAARSGTKMIRALVAAHENMRAVPYDVNYIWKYGNQNSPHDALDPASLSPRIERFIRRQLLRSAGLSASDEGCLVEKTVSNILRVPFVSAVLPDARYLVLIRDGRDVIESAQRCWRERPNLMYLLNKCRSFPWLSCLSYGMSFAKSTLRRLASRSQSPATWGPLYPGIQNHVASLPLVQVCAHQWRSCLDHYEMYRDLIPADRRLEIRYERLVREPQPEIDRIADFLGIAADRMQRHAADTLRPDNVGKHSTLTSDERADIERIAGPTLVHWGYELHTSTHELSRPHSNFAA